MVILFFLPSDWVSVGFVFKEFMRLILSIVRMMMVDEPVVEAVFLSC